MLIGLEQHLGRAEKGLGGEKLGGAAGETDFDARVARASRIRKTYAGPDPERPVTASSCDSSRIT
jgi:hypothetical protein